MSITLEAPRIAVAETMSDFELDPRFAFAALLVYSDAWCAGEDAGIVDW
ncbi:MAG TPA: hypothetical protein VIJ99_10885 [Acidimicrobiales bacterium]